MATINLGSIKFNWKGTYAGGTAYVVDDVVEYNGSSYICILASTGNLPTNATYFEQMSSAGTNGTDGTDLTSTLTTQGDIVYRNASGLARLGAGTSGQFLKTQGTGANPTWDTVVSKILGTSYISYGSRFQPPTSPSGTNSYAGTTNIFPANTFQYTKTIQNSHLQGWLVISGMGGSQVYHSRGTVSFSIDGSTLTDTQTVGTGTSATSDPNHTNYLFKVANNSPAGTITIDPRYGGNGNRWWDIINPNASDHAEYSVSTKSHMFIMEVAN
jgi:hypothetical protein